MAHIVAESTNNKCELGEIWQELIELSDVGQEEGSVHDWDMKK